MARKPEQTCPSPLLSEAVSAVQADSQGGLRYVDELLDDYPADPQLQFLRGSILAGLQRYPEAHQAMARAVELAPGYALARFQLGFLELTSGDATTADRTWRLLDRLPSTNPLRLFADGLRHLIKDQFEETIALLTQGIALNTEIAPLNADMRLIIERLNSVQTGSANEEPTSAAHLLLQQYTGKQTKH